ncbi:MAG: hypothetical protein KatS3mg081_2711 [Gemmatimonadales bacterium]|nr:MAG: hypothetical protein KatS3mg081_2711 [Gemmatimonadales bacterium]
MFPGFTTGIFSADRSIRRSVFALGLLGCLGCTSGSDLTVLVAAYSFDPEGYGGLVVEVRTGGRAWVIRSTDWVRTAFLQSPHVVLKVPDAGVLEVLVLLVANGDTIARGAIDFDLKPAYEWYVDISRGEIDPLRICLGACQASRSFPIKASHQRSPADSL